MPHSRASVCILHIVICLSHLFPRTDSPFFLFALVGTIIIIMRRPSLSSTSEPTLSPLAVDVKPHRSPFDKAFSVRVLIFGIWMIGALVVAADYYRDVSNSHFGMIS